MTAAPRVAAHGGDVARGPHEPSVWRRLLTATAALSAVAFAAVAAWLGDLEAGAYVLGFVLGLGLLRVRRGRVGVLLLVLLSLNVAGWMALSVVSHLRSGEGAAAVALPALLAALAAVTAIAGSTDTVRRSRPGGSHPAAWTVALGAASAFALVVAAGAATGGDAETVDDDSLFVVSNNVLFEPTELEATAGPVTIRMANRDLFWHTITIDALDVDLPVPVGGERSVVFEAPPGPYDYYCRIPGHEFRMRGTLVVRE